MSWRWPTRCGCHSALDIAMRRDGFTVVWDLKETEGTNPDEGELRFHAGQYDAEVARPSTDSNWEWPARTVARVLGDLLRSQTDWLVYWCCEAGCIWSSPWPTRYASTSSTTKRSPMARCAALRGPVRNDPLGHLREPQRTGTTSGPGDHGGRPARGRRNARRLPGRGRGAGLAGQRLPVPRPQQLQVAGCTAGAPLTSSCTCCTPRSADGESSGSTPLDQTGRERRRPGPLVRVLVDGLLGSSHGASED